MNTLFLESANPIMIGGRLAVARRSRGMTQQQVAEVLGVARTTVVAIENGTRRVRPNELVTLSSLFGRSVGELILVDVAAQQSFAVQFQSGRVAQSLRHHPGFLRDIDRFEKLCRWYAELEEMLSSPLPKRYPGVYDVSDTPLERAAAEVSASERNRLGLGDGPIGDLWGILETDVGIRVFAIPMSDRDIASMRVFTNLQGECLTLNAGHSEELRRWSAMRAYAHFLTDRDRPRVTTLEEHDRRFDEELFANAFARAMLLPTTGLQRRYDAIRRSKRGQISGFDVLTLSHLYGVPPLSLIRRLDELGLQSTGHPKSRSEDASHADRNHDEGTAVSIILPVRYEALAVEAFSRSLLSEGQLADRLCTDRIGARDRVLKLTAEVTAFERGEANPVSVELTPPLSGAA